MTTSTTHHPAVPLPAGAEFGSDWEDASADHIAWRVVHSAELHVDGCGATVYASAVQYEDGTIDQGRDAPEVKVVDVHHDDGLTAEQARALAARLVEAAAEGGSVVGPTTSAADQRKPRLITSRPRANQCPVIGMRYIRRREPSERLSGSTLGAGAADLPSDRTPNPPRENCEWPGRGQLGVGRTIPKPATASVATWTR